MRVVSENSPKPLTSVLTMNTSGGPLLLNLTQVMLEQRRLLQLTTRKDREDEAYFLDYVPPPRDAISLPHNVVYVLVGVVLVLVATYAIVGHLIKDLMHDLADWILGPKPVEDDSEEIGAKGEGQHRQSVSCKLLERDTLKMERENNAPLPGFHQRDGELRAPSILPPLRSSIAPSHTGEKRTSAHSVSFSCPEAPRVTSL